MTKIIVIIPALNPDDGLIHLVQALREQGLSNIVVVNDGSGPEYQSVFQKIESMGCGLVTHERNRGKGAAIKSGITESIRSYGKGNAYVTADADGQHLPEDIYKVAMQLCRRPDALILGTRDFGGRNVPWKSRWGNRITSLFFRVSNGIACPDTQTGLRGIPACMEELAVREDGDRYDYEMNFLADAVKQVPLCFVPIQTIYKDRNRASFFRPFTDSLLVYGRFLRFLGASLAGAVSDFLLFYFLCKLPLASLANRVIVATILARLCSGAINYLLNRFWSFHSRMPVGIEAFRYGVLFICQMAASAVFTTILTFLHIPSVLAKLIVDTCLFFISFIIQKDWVFRGRR